MIIKKFSYLQTEDPRGIKVVDTTNEKPDVTTNQSLIGWLAGSYASTNQGLSYLASTVSNINSLITDNNRDDVLLYCDTSNESSTISGQDNTYLDNYHCKIYAKFIGKNELSSYLTNKMNGTYTFEIDGTEIEDFSKTGPNAGNQLAAAILNHSNGKTTKLVGFSPKVLQTNPQGKVDQANLIAQGCNTITGIKAHINDVEGLYLELTRQEGIQQLKAHEPVFKTPANVGNNPIYAFMRNQSTGIPNETSQALYSSSRSSAIQCVSYWVS